MNENFFIPITSVVIIVIIIIIFLFNYNEHLIIKETRKEIDKFNDEYFKDLRQKETQIFDFKVENIEELEDLVKDLNELSLDLTSQITQVSNKINDVEKKVNDIEIKINEKNDDINVLKRKILEEK